MTNYTLCKETAIQYVNILPDDLNEFCIAAVKTSDEKCVNVCKIPKTETCNSDADCDDKSVCTWFRSKV